MTRTLVITVVLLAAAAGTPWIAQDASAAEDVCQAVLHDQLGLMVPCTSGPPTAHDLCEDVVHDQLGFMIPCPP